MLSLWDINLFLHLIYRTCRIIKTLLCMSSRHFWIIAGRHRACKGTSSSDYSTSIINQNVCRFLNIKLTENWYALHTLTFSWTVLNFSANSWLQYTVSCYEYSSLFKAYHMVSYTECFALGRNHYVIMQIVFKKSCLLYMYTIL